MTSLDVRFESVVEDKFRFLLEHASTRFPNAHVALIIWHELLEAILLLHLGIQLECLSEDMSGKIRVKWFFLREALQDGPHAFPRKRYLDIPFGELSRSFRTFPEALQRDPPALALEVTPLKITNIEDFKPAFEKILLLELQMLQDSSIRTFLEVVKYWREDDWREIHYERSRPEDVASSAESSAKTGSVVLYGFIRSFGYWFEVQESLNLLNSSSDATRFIERIRRILNWRVDFASREQFKRFDDLRKHIVSNAVSEVPVADRTKLQKDLDRIFDEVLGPLRVQL